MKKTFAIVILALGLTACSNERTAISTVQSMKTPEMVKFDQALRSLGNPENRPTAEEIETAKRTHSAELSDRRKAVLIPASMEIIESTGVTERDIMSKTGNDKTKIILWALDIYHKTNKVNSSNLQN